MTICNRTLYRETLHRIWKDDRRFPVLLLVIGILSILAALPVTLIATFDPIRQNTISMLSTRPEKETAAENTAVRPTTPKESTAAPRSEKVFPPDATPKKNNLKTRIWIVLAQIPVSWLSTIFAIGFFGEIINHFRTDLKRGLISGFHQWKFALIPVILQFISTFLLENENEICLLLSVLFNLLIGLWWPFAMGVAAAEETESSIVILFSRSISLLKRGWSKLVLTLLAMLGIGYAAIFQTIFWGILFIALRETSGRWILFFILLISLLQMFLLFLFLIFGYCGYLPLLCKKLMQQESD